MVGTQHLVRVAFVVLASLSSTTLGVAQDVVVAEPVERSSPCATPREAARTWLAHLPPSGDRPELAARCFDWGSAGVSAADASRQARKLKEVFDRNGWYVDVEALPDVVQLPEDAVQTLVLSRLASDFHLERAPDGTWWIAGEGLTRIDAMHERAFAVDVSGLVQRGPAWLEHRVLGVEVWQLFGVFVALLLGLLARALVVFVLVHQVTRWLAKMRQTSDGKIVRRAARPLGTLAMAGALWWVLPMLRFGVRVNQIGGVALRVMATSATVLLLYRLVDLGADLFAKRAAGTETKFDDQIVPLVRKTAKVFVAVVGVIFVLQNLDVDVGSLLAGVSLGGLAFTLAAKDTVANLFGSVSIFADQPFQIGDWVVVAGHEGVVEEVGMRSTRIRTFYDSLVTIPNAKVADASIDNYGRRRFRRQTFEVGITYDSTAEQVQAFVEGIRAILRANETVRQDSFEVHFRHFGASSLQVFVYFFLKVPSWSEELRQRQNVLLEILRLAERLGVDFAFPTQTLHLQTVTQPQPIEPRRVPSSDELAKAVKGHGPGGAHALAETPLLTEGYFPTSEAVRGEG
jgi:MscS family membrane protein